MFKINQKLILTFFLIPKIFLKCCQNHLLLLVLAVLYIMGKRCLLLIPSIVINAAANQDTIIKELVKEKLTYYAGSFKSKKLDIISGIKYYNDKKNIKFYKNKAKQKFDNNGIKKELFIN